MRQINQVVVNRAMPNDIVFVRHGESESNYVQRLNRIGIDKPEFEQVASLPDWQQRLTKEGVEQAKLAGQWLDDNMGGVGSFDGCYVSPFIRTRETAAHLGEADWIIDDRIIERFRGIYGVEKYDEESINHLMEIRDTSPWYARLDYGESLQDVFQRYRIFQSSVKRHHAGERVMVVSHSDLIKTARYAIEWMLPEQWQESFFDAKQHIENCNMIHYSRVNPYNPTEIDEGIKWVRLIDPVNNKVSKWRELEIKRRYQSRDLISSVEKFPNIL